MKLLILTQKVDKEDTLLGFFHRWIEEFSKHFESITVICLQEGEYNLPKNVKVLSLGKEEKQSRFQYVIRFYSYIWKERKNYDTVFVHMNQEYVLLGALVWKLLRKKISLWRNHHAGNIFTLTAMLLSDRIFCTSKYSFTAHSKKTILMPVGIDTEFFKNTDNQRKQSSILFLARMSPVKGTHIVIEALNILHKKGVHFTADFYGDPLPKDESYLYSLKEKVRSYDLNGIINFEKGIPNTETLQVYNSHEIFINPSPSGMYDKTIFEAAACGMLVLTSNKNLKGKINDKFIFREKDSSDLAKSLEKLLFLSFEEKKKQGEELRTFTVSYHSLLLLGNKLAKYLMH